MIEKLRKLHTDVKILKKSVSDLSSERINKKTIRNKAEDIGEQWFSEFSESLVEKFIIPTEVIKSYSTDFSRLIKISAPNNRKGSYLITLNNILKNFRDDLIIPLQKKSTGPSKTTLLANVIDGLNLLPENEYLNEAINCAHHDFYRASAVLGWCAAIDRIHRVIQRDGFVKFNVTSAQMASQTKGRFKKFNQPQNVVSLSELREVFDTIILWILEGMELIDSNQHTRLRSCFDLRCQCAHPGDAPITEYNLLSFYSDLNHIVFKNDKFNV